MVLHVLSPYIHRRVGILLIAMLVVIATAGRATAGCGDYVIVLQQDDETDAEMPTPEKPPCHGPNCSADPTNSVPVPVAYGSNRPTNTKDLSTAFTVSTPTAPPVVVSFEIVSARPLDSVSFTFRPPRA